MKRLLFVAALAVAAIPALATGATVSVAVGQPGFHGRIEINDFPQPRLLYPEPLLVQPAPVGVVLQPIYLYVPQGQAKDWRKHCKKYKACGQPVYFVQEHWYQEVYVPEYRDRHGHGKGGKKHGGKAKHPNKE